jgi:hypothetical protein
MFMERITIELPIVKVRIEDPWCGCDYGKEHYEKGLFVIDDGISRYFAMWDGLSLWHCPMPHSSIDKYIVERAISDNGEIYHRDMEAIKERLKSMSNAITSNGKVLDFLRNEISAHTAVVNEMWDGVVDDMKENHKEVMMKLGDMPKSVGGEGVNILDVARAAAVIQKPELIKELSK